MKYYAIGDVHGEYKTLIELMSRIPGESELFFTGDLIDRGPDSQKVVDLVRSDSHHCVLGNHEVMMIEEAHKMQKLRAEYIVDDLWALNGGLSVLLSYGIIEAVDEEIAYTRDEAAIDKFLDDAEWMASLPLYLKAPVKWRDRYDILISHASIGRDWQRVVSIRSGDKQYDFIRNYATWNREQRGADPSSQVFNVFGHTPQVVLNTPSDVDDTRNWINIDTGCTYDRDGQGRLTAVDLESFETISVQRVE
jgi:serine/threonine protein phosphatase 1